jgi:hypothetical protein
MLLPHSEAMRFIEGYNSVLLEVLSSAGKKRGKDIVSDLAAARSLATENTSAIANAMRAMNDHGETLDSEVARAISSLRVGRWFHLRHTTKYALLLDARAEHAYAVKALTNPLHEIAGARAVTFEAGVFEYQGQYVCDGVVLQLIHLGPGIRAELKEAYARITTEGRFHANTAA